MSTDPHIINWHPRQECKRQSRLFVFHTDSPESETAHSLSNTGRILYYNKKCLWSFRIKATKGGSSGPVTTTKICIIVHTIASQYQDKKILIKNCFNNVPVPVLKTSSKHNTASQWTNKKLAQKYMHKKQDLGNTTSSEFWQDNDYDQVNTYYINDHPFHSTVLCSTAPTAPMLNMHQSGVLTALFGCYMAGATWNCCHLGTCSVYTIQPCTSLQS